MQTCVYSCREYLELWEPTTFSLLLDPPKAFLDDTKKAAEIAKSIGERPVVNSVDNLERYSLATWRLLYGEPEVDYCGDVEPTQLAA